ncbi:MAG: isoprenylcysteine carboxylmethyltransferase family protein [Rhodobacteraceae bacterium]|nr:isoprenylcysteine carboxylmethyltransferase family protein [Paracoccaceae bacterium]
MNATATTPARPVNQRRRIAVLRLSALAAAPAILCARAPWTGPVFEVLEVSGVLLLIMAVLGRLWAILYIGGHKNGTVMQEGPYSVCRHPLYTFSLVGIAGFGLMLGSVVVTAAITALAFVIFARTARREEQFLRATFGSRWDDYAARVPALVPNPRLFATAGTISVRVAPLRGNLGDALVFLAAIPLAEAMEGLKLAGLVPTFPVW